MNDRAKQAQKWAEMRGYESCAEKRTWRIKSVQRECLTTLALAQANLSQGLLRAMKLFRSYFVFISEEQID